MDTAIDAGLPLNLTAMRYYASSMKLQHEQGNINDDYYFNVMLAQLDYLSEWRLWDIIYDIQQELLPDKFKASYTQEIIERQTRDKA